MRAVAVDGRGLGLARLASGLGQGLARLTSGLGLVLGPGRGSGLEVDVGVVEGVGLVEVGVPSTWHRVPHPHLRPRHWEK